MPFFDLYNGLPSGEQLLHGLHFMLCCFAVLLACVPLLTAKGSVEHKLSGLIYLPVSGAALLLAAWMAYAEASFMLFGFSAFCAWLLLSGWRAVHENAQPKLIDWLIPLGLIALCVAVAAHAAMIDDARRGLYLIFYALNGFYLGGRDVQRLVTRRGPQRRKLFFASAQLNAAFGTTPPSSGWLNRHVAGMAGSLMANLSVVVLTLLPAGLHWLWPAALMLMGGWVALHQRQKKLRVKEALAVVMKPGFARKKLAPDVRRAA